MANSISISGTSAIQLASGEDAIVNSIVFSVSAAAGGLSMIPQIALGDSGDAAVNVQYINLATGAISAAGTPITANGLYGVFAPGCDVTLLPSAGTGTVKWRVVAGRVM